MLFYTMKTKSSIMDFSQFWEHKRKIIRHSTSDQDNRYTWFWDDFLEKRQKKFFQFKKSLYLCTPLQKLGVYHRHKIVLFNILKIYLNKMKKDIHPSNYREVAFKDMSNEEVFITRSTVNTKETIDIDGKTYPLVKLEITNTSHPFFTGKQKLVDTAGRVDKFMQRYGNRKKK